MTQHNQHADQNQILEQDQSQTLHHKNLLAVFKAIQHLTNGYLGDGDLDRAAICQDQATVFLNSLRNVPAVNKPAPATKPRAELKSPAKAFPTRLNPAEQATRSEV